MPEFRKWHFGASRLQNFLVKHARSCLGEGAPWLLKCYCCLIYRVYRLLHNILKPLTVTLLEERIISKMRGHRKHTTYWRTLNYQFIGKLHCILGHGKVAESTITGLLLVQVSLGFATVGLSVVLFSYVALFFTGFALLFLTGDRFPVSSTSSDFLFCCLTRN